MTENRIADWMQIINGGITARIVSFSSDEDTLERLERLEKRMGHLNRSELVRAALQALERESDSLDELPERANGIMAVVHHPSREDEVSKLKHRFGDIVTTQIHNNWRGRCLELFVVEGRGDVLATFFKELKKSKSVTYVTFIPMNV